MKRENVLCTAKVVVVGIGCNAQTRRRNEAEGNSNLMNACIKGATAAIRYVIARLNWFFSFLFFGGNSSD